VVGASVLIASSAMAHRPLFPAVSPDSPGSAAVVKRPEVSHVVYHEIAEGPNQLWLTFEGQKDQEVFLQIGVPVIGRLKGYRPTMALIGPGLPTGDAPFELPAGCGIEAFPTAGVAEPRYFEEHFTGTDSWILRDATVRLPESGVYYAVAYSPNGKAGKLWLSIGQKEEFGLGDLGRMRDWTRRVRAFHEVDGTWPRLQKIAAGGLAGVTAGVIWLIVRLLSK
jgi:hypothetical protein